MIYLISIVLSLPLVGAYGILAIGIVLIYRASRVLNLAHGAMAMIPGYVLYELTRMGLPVGVGFPLAIATGGLLGWAVERVFVRRLRGESLTAQTVGAVAALGLLVAFAARVWGTSALNAVQIFPEGRISVGLSNISFGELGLFVVMIVVAGGLFVLIQRTDLGLKMRGAAESRLAASLMGVNPQRITTFTWVLGGSLAALAGILLAAVTSLHPYVLALQALPAFIGALIGGLESMPGALVGSAVVGVTLGLVPVIGPLRDIQGAPQLLLAVLAMVAMARRGARLVAGDIRAALDETPAAAARRREPAEERDAEEVPEETRPLEDEAAVKPPASVRRGLTPRGVLVLLGVAIAVGFPWVAPFSVLGAVNLGAIYAMVAISLVLLTGWVGQISLGHSALVGVGAYATGWATAAGHIPFPLSLPIAALVTAGLASLLGVVAFRVRGLYLAVATLVFSWMGSEFLFRQRWFIRYDQIPDRPIGGRGWFPSFDFNDRRVFYVVAWALVAAVAYAASNLRESKTGRSFFAVRGSEMAAASLGIDVTRTKLLAFAASGAIAGAAGNLAMSMQRVVTADQFTFNVSLFFLAIAVVGGLSSLGGTVASALLFGGLTEVFFRVRVLGGYLEIVSALLLAVVLLAYRGGLASLPARVVAFRERIRRRLRRVQSAAERGAERVLERLPKAKGPEGATTPEAERTPLQRVFGSLLGNLRRADAALRARLPRAPGASRRSQASGREPSRSPRRLLAVGARRLARALPGNGGRQSPPAAEPPLDFRAVLEGNESPAEAASLPVAHAGEVSPNGHGQRRSIDLATLRVEGTPSGPRDLRRPLIEAEHVTVRFGGLVAVNDASLSAREGEICGLIGPNGAGKTTLFNAIAGYNDPTEGVIRLYGHDVTGLPVHLRARVGVARTFQLIQLFGELSVYDNLLVATHVHNPTGFFGHLAAVDRSLVAEGAARDRVEETLELLDLSRVAHQRTADLPFGVLRMVEVARALVTGFRVMMLDEPASGLDNSETDRLMDVLRFVRALGVTMLLIEHDVRMVTGVSDYIYVLDQGRMIAEGTPEQIQRNPAVVAAYLGEPEKEKETVS